VVAVIVLCLCVKPDWFTFKIFFSDEKSCTFTNDSRIVLTIISWIIQQIDPISIQPNITVNRIRSYLKNACINYDNFSVIWLLAELICCGIEEDTEPFRDVRCITCLASPGLRTYKPLMRAFRTSTFQDV
jgi:hypothetical protein